MNEAPVVDLERQGLGFASPTDADEIEGHSEITPPQFDNENAWPEGSLCRDTGRLGLLANPGGAFIQW